MLAANQGLYNGFLAAGLIWGLVRARPAFAFQIKMFFLLCVIVAGVYGAMTVSRRILFVQALPAALALILLWLGLSVVHPIRPRIVLHCRIPSSTIPPAMASAAARNPDQDHRHNHMTGGTAT